MQILAITFFAVAALLSAVLMPNSMSLIPLLLVSAARAIALAGALLFWVASGRVDSWGSSRLLLILTMILGAAALSGGCFVIQMVRDDTVPAPFPMLYRVTAGLLPICMIAGALLPSRKLFLIVAALAPVAGILAASTWKPLNARYNANLPYVKENRANQLLIARRLAELDAIPETAGLEPLLAFVNPGEPYEVRHQAQERILGAPDSIAQLSAMLDGENRVAALYVLTRKDGLQDGEEERCWDVAGRIARDRMELLKKGTPSTDADERLLLDSVVAMANHSEAERQRHWKEMAEVREFLLATNAAVGTGAVDFWVRQSQLRRIPEDAGIVPLLEFAAPSEVWDVRREALARIAKDPESTAKLTKLLDGPHRLDALVVLADRAEGLSQDLLELCWRSAGITASEMAGDIAQGRPPTRIDVRKLSSSVGSFWIKLGSAPDGRLADLATVRDVVRAVGDDVEKASFAWADGALASSPPPSAERPK